MYFTVVPSDGVKPLVTPDTGAPIEVPPLEGFISAVKESRPQEAKVPGGNFNKLYRLQIFIINSSKFV